MPYDVARDSGSAAATSQTGSTAGAQTGVLSARGPNDAPRTNWPRRAIAFARGTAGDAIASATTRASASRREFRRGGRSRGSVVTHCSSTPDAAARPVPARLLLLCLLLRSSWLTVEGGRQIGAAGVLHSRGGRAALAVSVGVAGGVPQRQPARGSTALLPCLSRRLLACGSSETEQAETVWTETAANLGIAGVTAPRIGGLLRFLNLRSLIRAPAPGELWVSGPVRATEAQLGDLRSIYGCSRVIGMAESADGAPHILVWSDYI